MNLVIRFKKQIALLLIVVVVFSAFAFKVQDTVDARTLSQVEADIREYEALLKKYQNERAALDAEIKKQDKDKKLTEKDLALYVNEISYLEAEILLTEETIESYARKLAEIEVDIMIKEEDLDYYEGMYASIIRYSFMQGDITIFQILFQADSFSDFLTRIDSINYFLSYTDTIMKTIKSAKNDLVIIKEKHETTKAALDEYKDGLESSVADLEAKKKDTDQKAQSLGTNLSELNKKYQSAGSSLEQTKTRLAALKKERQEILDADKGYIWPLKTSSYWISSLYGWRTDPFNSKKQQYHNGLDIACAAGTPIYAVKGGTVIRSEMAAGWGNVVVIYHGNGIQTLYAHASKRIAKVGDVVKQGDKIAEVGTTGSSTGNHLHISFLVNGAYADPAKYLPKGYIR